MNNISAFQHDDSRRALVQLISTIVPPGYQFVLLIGSTSGPGATLGTMHPKDAIAVMRESISQLEAGQQIEDSTHPD